MIYDGFSICCLGRPENEVRNPQSSLYHTDFSRLMHNREIEQKVANSNSEEQCVLPSIAHLDRFYKAR